jgi:His/Glu/Gln/Arg/opine family amino acid ABC transporter permease subunit
VSDLHDLIVNILPAARVTIEITLGAWLISVVLGATLAIIGVQGPRPMRVSVGGTIYVLRSVPPLVALYVIYFGLPSAGVSISPIFASIIGLGVLDAVYSAEYYRAALRTIALPQWEAAFSLGMSPWSSMRLVVLPQTIPFIMPPTINSLVGMMKAAVYASAIGAPELLFTGETYMSTTGQVTEVAVFIMGLYLIATIPLTRLAGRLEQRVRTAHG